MSLGCAVARWGGLEPSHGAAQSTKAPLDEVMGRFFKTFSKSDHFKVGSVVCALLEDNMLARAEVRVGNAFAAGCAAPAGRA